LDLRPSNKKEQKKANTKHINTRQNKNNPPKEQTNKTSNKKKHKPERNRTTTRFELVFGFCLQGCYEIAPGQPGRKLEMPLRLGNVQLHNMELRG